MNVDSAEKRLAPHAPNRENRADKRRRGLRPLACQPRCARSFTPLVPRSVSAFQVTRSPRCLTGVVDVCKQTSFFNWSNVVERNSTSAAAQCATNTREITGVMVNPSAKGAQSEAAILYALVASGRTVLMPWGGSQRYDFVIDEGDGHFTRVQCKTGVF